MGLLLFLIALYLLFDGDYLFIAIVLMVCAYKV
jgi:hypothetical protein